MSVTTTHKPIIGPAAWHPRDFPDADAAYSVTLGERHFAAFDSALAVNRGAGRALEDVGRDDFALAPIAADLAAWRHEVLHGRGFAVLRAFPLDRYSADDLGAIFWGLGTHFGRAVSQSPLGDRIGHVVDVGGKDRRERAYRNSRELTLHTDRADVLGMLCLQPAMSGGVSGYASAHTIHNEILASRPDLLEPLYTGFRYHRRGEQLAGEPAITAEPVPVLSECEGETSVVFLRSYMEMAAAELGQPLTDHQRAALDYFEEVAARDDVKLSFTMQPGEAIFFNNCVLLHNRTAFEDHPDPARKRHLLRLWLMLDGTRPLAPAVHAYKGTRGIVGRDGGTTYYTGEALPSATRGI